MKRLMMTAVCVAACGLVGCSECPVDLDWGELPPLPAAPGQVANIGLAGPYAGLHNDALIVAGGANFPTPLLEGGTKIWWDDIFVLKKDGAWYTWATGRGFKLPRPLAYGVSISTADGVVCIGGCDSKQSYDDCFMLSWDAKSQTISRKSLPPLPVPLAFMAGAKVGQTIYVAGGSAGAGATKSFFALDLAKRGDSEAFGWRAVAPWPGEARILPTAVAQSNGTNPCLYLVSGRNAKGLLRDAYCYDPAAGKWTRIADVGTPESNPVCVMAAPGVPCGSQNIRIFGGDTGEVFQELSALGKEIAALEADPARKAQFADAKARRDKTLRTHPGFNRDILAYNTRSDRWTKVGEMPTGSHVTSCALVWDKAIIIVSGEISPGIRTPRILRARAADPWYLRCWFCN